MKMIIWTMQQMQNINSKQILWDSMYFYITVSYFSIYFHFPTFVGVQTY